MTKNTNDFEGVIGDHNGRATVFCDAFMFGPQPKYVFGTNEWARSIADNVSIDGFIDDYREGKTFCGLPVIRRENLPKSAKVVSAVVLGRPLTALTRIRELGVDCLDYFAFHKYSGLSLLRVSVVDDFLEEFLANREKYFQIYNRLADDESRVIFERLLKFRLSKNLSFMEGFIDAQSRQYFEPFLNLKSNDEVFVDIGSYDGYTTQQFLNRCPKYGAIHVFEPEPSNMAVVKERLKDYKDIFYYPYGAHSEEKSFALTSAGSASSLCANGDLTINLVRIDDVIHQPFSFLKMDIEGSELEALRGGSNSIRACQPRLAVGVYHKVDDFWRIPNFVLSINENYKIYLRHYTEGVTETVMFFV
jgi:FkbM family methyltransferase